LRFDLLRVTVDSDPAEMLKICPLLRGIERASPEMLSALAEHQGDVGDRYAYSALQISSFILEIR